MCPERYETEQLLTDADREFQQRRRQVMNNSVARNLESDFQEITLDKVYNTPEASVMLVAEALRNKPNLNLELERIKVILKTTFVQLRR